jgi:TPP-dependent pyruvate/acetoin dehydrogenase alpha subunit
MRAGNYGIYGETVDGNNVLAVLDAMNRARAMCVDGRGPVLLETKTFRRKGHAEHDDAGYVPEDLRREWEQKDPLDAFSRYLVGSKGLFSQKEIEEIDDTIEKEIEKDVQAALEAPFPEPDVHAEDVYAR